MSGILPSFLKPTPPKMARENPTPRRSVSVTRLARKNPYDEVEVGGSGDTDDLSQPALSSQRANLSHGTSNTYRFATDGRQSASKTKRWGPPTLAKRSFDEFQKEGPKLDTQASAEKMTNSFDALKSPTRASRIVSESSSAADEIRVDSGARHTTASPELDNAHSQADEIEVGGGDKAKDKEGSVEAEDDEEEDEEEEEPVRIMPTINFRGPGPATDESEDDQQHEIKALLNHKFDPDGVQFLVHWADETRESATWESEDEIQLHADTMLFAYWDRKGGRDKVLFEDAKEPRPAEYHVFRVLRHEKDKKRGFELEVQWVGYPANSDNTTWEREPKLKSIAPDHLNEYWDSKGGRAQFLNGPRRAKRGNKRVKIG